MEAPLQGSVAAEIYVLQHHHGISVLGCDLDIPVSMYVCDVRSLVSVDENRDGCGCAEYGVDFLGGLVRYRHGGGGADMASQNRRLQVL